MAKRNNKKFNTIIINWPNILEWLAIFHYTYHEERNIGAKKKYIVTDGYQLQYYYIDSIHSLQANRKHFIFDEFNEKYKIMTSYCASKPLLYKCYINNINNNIFVTKTIIDKIPEDYKLCKFNEVLEYCTQLSLTL
ncbi:MAG: hypothetical protein IKO36_04225 [Bacteroidaceae bacterium]|nr:hypothetical protein [Bacteroidaceae bacterium]